MDKKICIKKFLGEESFLIGNASTMINHGKSISFDPELLKYTHIPKILNKSSKKYSKKRF